MDAQLRAQAETRLQEAAAALGLVDPRPAYRERLRRLRGDDATAFNRAVAYYEQTVLPALATADPFAAWLDYGRILAGGTTRTTLIDVDGRASTLAAPVPPDSLVLLIPEEHSADVLVGAAPLQPSPAQQATLDLLVTRRLTLSEG